MKKFGKIIFLFSVPLIVYLCIAAIIDPFGYLKSFNSIKNNQKDKIASSIEPHLYRIIKFENNPKKNIVIGDSRSESLYTTIKSKGNQNWAELAYGGASLKEMIQTFWWASKETKLDSVVMGINLNHYNRFNKRIWVEETLERKKSFLSYAFSKYVFLSTFHVIKYMLLAEKQDFFKVEMTKDQFWEFTLNKTASKFYEKFDYPTDYHAELEKISKYCSDNDVKLILWISPTHIDFQKKKDDFNLRDADAKFVSDLDRLGTLYNFDYSSEITTNKADYTDPMHFDSSISEIIYNVLFQDVPKRYHK